MPRGRAPHVPTPEMQKTVEMLAAVGTPQQEIANLQHLSINTLRKHYKDELKTGATKANAKVAESLFRQATGPKPNVAATIFWLKVRNQWREPKIENEHLHSGKLVVEHVEKPLPAWAKKEA